MSRLLSKIIIVFVLLVLVYQPNLAQQNSEIVESSKFDTGKMWTFDFPPVDYLRETYGFEATEEWLEDVRLSALRIPGCTASFVSEDGLIMTNHHCSEGARDRVQKDGEDLKESAFYAETLEDERKVPRMYADQLVLIKDISDEIFAAMDEVKNDADKADARDQKIEQLEKEYSEETGLRCQIVSYFNGGRFALHGFKRYEDVRLVFIPEEKIAYFGGDFDNFTYPRYNLDCTFYRVYDDEGKPLKSTNFYKWSSDGALEDELIFVVGNPGTTNRLKTVSQLKYFRDVQYRNITFLLDELYNRLEAMKSVYPDRADDFEAVKTRWGNSQKVYHNIYEGLIDPYLMARKEDFENKIKEQVFADDELKEKFGSVWESIETTRDEMNKIGPKIYAYNTGYRFSSDHFKIATRLVEYYKQMQMDAEKRDEAYKGEELEKTLARVYPEEFDEVMELISLGVYLDYLKLNLGENELLNPLMNGEEGLDAAKYLVSKTKLNEKTFVDDLVQNPDKIAETNDPIINYVLSVIDEYNSLSERRTEIETTESVQENLLGQALYALYGTSIPPDANRTLRLGDGTLLGFNYNGTKTPLKTTFYGMYDRYYGFEGNYPWELPARWENAPVEFDLATPYNFVSLHDIVGGSSGSAVINSNAEVVGLAFDGNVHSIIGNFIYMPELNRMVSVSSQAMLESIDKVYKAKNLANELRNGKR